MSSEPNIKELIQQAIEARREGRRKQAADLLRQVVKLDEKNEKAWLWLASVVDNDAEKRTALENVLFINPHNETAQQLLAKLGTRVTLETAENEVVPGISRRQLTIIGAVGGGFLLLIILVLSVLTVSVNADTARQTASALEAIATGTAVAYIQQTQAAQAQETLFALASPTPTATATFDRPTLPPEISMITPTTTPEPTRTPLPYPAGVSGRIAGWSGRDTAQFGYLPLVLYTLETGGAPQQIGDAVGGDVDFSADGSRLVYTRFFPTTFDTGIEQTSFVGSSSVVTLGQPVLKAQMPSYCSNANRIVFSALPAEAPADPTATVFPYQVFVLSLDSNELFRLTNDRSSYTHPTYSPDCTRIVVVRTEISGVSQGSDLVLIDTNSLAQTPLTNDLGVFNEDMPNWSPDGTQVVYSAAPGSDPQNHDIVLRRADPSSTPLVILREAADEIHPVFSPDAQYIAYSSNRTGFYDIYLYNQSSGEVFQLTNTDAEDYAGAWR